MCDYVTRKLVFTRFIKKCASVCVCKSDKTLSRHSNMVLLEYFMHGYIPDDSSSVDRIIVSEGITTLPQRTLTDAEGDYQVGCFQKYTNLVHCQLPRSFLILPPQTLAYCEKLVEIHIVHTQIKVIEDHAFANCIMLESIFFPVTCVRIGLGAFSRCKALRTCYLPGGLRQIDSQGELCLCLCAMQI